MALAGGYIYFALKTANGMLHDCQSQKEREIEYTVVEQPNYESERE